MFYNFLAYTYMYIQSMTAQATICPDRGTIDLQGCS